MDVYEKCVSLEAFSSLGISRNRGCPTTPHYKNRSGRRLGLAILKIAAVPVSKAQTSISSTPGVFWKWASSTANHFILSHSFQVVCHFYFSPVSGLHIETYTPRSIWLNSIIVQVTSYDQYRFLWS